MVRRRKKPTEPKVWNGDHGTGTMAAAQGTEIVPLEGNNPNRFARRHRIEQIERLKPRLFLREYQAALAIRNAYCKVQMLSSGSPISAKVDTFPRPDAIISTQVDAVSFLTHVMSPVPGAMRDVVEHVCWHNLPLRHIVTGGRSHYTRLAELKVALNLVANHLRY